MAETEDELNSVRDGDNLQVDPLRDGYTFRIPRDDEPGVIDFFRSCVKSKTTPMVDVEFYAIEEGEPFLARQALVFARRLRSMLHESGWRVTEHIERYDCESVQDALVPGITIRHCNAGDVQASHLRFILDDQRKVPARLIGHAISAQPLRIFVGLFEIDKTERYIYELNHRAKATYSSTKPVG